MNQSCEKTIVRVDNNVNDQRLEPQFIYIHCFLFHVQSAASPSFNPTLFLVSAPLNNIFHQPHGGI